MKRKRLLIQLSIVSAVLALGGVAIFQGLRSSGQSQATEKSLSQQQTDQHEPRAPSMIPDDSNPQQHTGPSPAVFAATESDRQISVPSPDETVIRGNDDHSPAAPPASVHFDGAPAGGQFIPQPPGDRFTGRPLPTQAGQDQDQGDTQEPSRFVGAPITSSISDQGDEQTSAYNNTQPANATDDAEPTNDLRSGETPPAAQAFQPSSLGDRFAAGTVDSPIAPPPVTSEASPPGQFSTPDHSSEAAAPPGAFRGRPFAAETGHPSTVTSPAQPTMPDSPPRPAAALPAVASGAAAVAAQPQLEAAGVPGARELDGAQAPSLVIEKIAPEEIQVGIAATFEIRVRNVGQVDAYNVLITDRVPSGTRFIDGSSNYQLHNDGSISWQLDTLQPGGETTLNMEVMPLEEGEIGSVASVSFQAQASVRTICTRPELQVQHTAPAKVLIGQTVAFSITLSNPGSGAATDVVLEEDVPAGLTHDAGNELEYQVGTLRPGETKQLELTLRASQAGIVHNTLRLRANGNLAVQDDLELEVIAPQLQVELDGPALRYLNRKATYTVSVANPGTAPAKNVELIAYLPKGFEFQSTDNEGFYDSQRHAVLWSLEELPPQQVGDVRLELIPKDTGEQKIRLEGRADLDLNHVFEKTVAVDARPELQFSITDSADPIEVGSDTAYEIRVTNAGAKTATNVRLAAVVPPGLKMAKVDGPTRGAISGQQALFEPLARLAPGANVVYQIQASGVTAGDHRIQVQLGNDDSPAPITQEESTRVYQDQ